jgi:uncharacterized protein YndB with AHSA1/START domain
MTTEQSPEQANDRTPNTGHDHTVRAARRVTASPETVWSAWADPDRLAHWFTTHAEQDLRVGGRYRNGDGDEGEFLEIVPGRRLKFTWEQADYAPGSDVTVEIIPADNGGTEIYVEHAHIACDDTEDLETGWNWALDSLVSYLTTGMGIR